MHYVTTAFALFAAANALALPARLGEQAKQAYGLDGQDGQDDQVGQDGQGLRFSPVIGIGGQGGNAAFGPGGSGGPGITGAGPFRFQSGTRGGEFNFPSGSASTSGEGGYRAEGSGTSVGAPAGLEFGSVGGAPFANRPGAQGGDGNQQYGRRCVCTLNNQRAPQQLTQQACQDLNGPSSDPHFDSRSSTCFNQNQNGLEQNFAAACQRQGQQFTENQFSSDQDDGQVSGFCY